MSDPVGGSGSDPDGGPDGTVAAGGRPVGRRTVLAAGLGLGVAGLGVAGTTAAVLGRDLRRFPERRLFAAGVGIEPDGARVLIPVRGLEAVAPGSRVITGSGSPGARSQLAAERLWLGSGGVPGGLPDGPGRWSGRWSGMAVDALLDLRVLLLDGGATVASWAGPWRYVWPRDASFVAAALGAAGHPEDAASVLLFLQRMQRPDGLFEARYLPDGSGVPDDRGVQLDGSGWVLWAVRRVVSALPAEEQRAALGRYRALIDRSTAAVVAMAAGPSGLPPASRDYWELAETRVTLGIAAPVLAGLQAAASLYRQLGEARAQQTAVRAEDALEAAVRKRFGPDYARYPTYTRYRGSPERDAAVTFLCPPIFTPRLAAGRITTARHLAERALRRPGGGLAPGTGWPDDGVSWTPETALFALAAAGAGEQERAARWLDWLATHRTGIGALPEKVIADGAPAGPAPLAWTAALVLLTLHELDAAAAG